MPGKCKFIAIWLAVVISPMNTLAQGDAQSIQSLNTNSLWDESVESFTLADSLITKGNKNLADGRKLVLDGEAIMQEANEALTIALESYRTIVDSVEPTQESAAELTLLSDSIDMRIAEIASGNRLVGKGNEIISEGQKQIRSGRESFELGSKKAKKSQRVIQFQLILPD